MSQFSELKPFFRLFDVATGNGAIALLAEKYSVEHGMNFSISACDSAEIVVPKNSSVKFYSGLKFEEVSLGEASIDFASSNFGLEYMDYLKSLEKVYSILRSGGRFSALLHSDTSVVMHKCKIEYDLYVHVFERLKLFESLELFFKSRNDKKNVDGLKSKINTDINSFISENPGEELPKEIAGAIAQIFRGLAAGRSNEWVFYSLALLESEFYSASLRVADMVGAALSFDQINALCGTMREVGFIDISLDKFMGSDGGHEYGWSLVAIRA